MGRISNFFHSRTGSTTDTGVGAGAALQDSKEQLIVGRGEGDGELTKDHKQMSNSTGHPHAHPAPPTSGGLRPVDLAVGGKRTQYRVNPTHSRSGSSTTSAVTPSPPPSMVEVDGQRDSRLAPPTPLLAEQSILSPPNAPFTAISRPASPQSAGENEVKKKNRMSVFVGGGSPGVLTKKSKIKDAGSDAMCNRGWKLQLNPITGGLHGEDYDLTQIETGREVPDLWDPLGDTLVYLCAPPFKLPLMDEPKPSFRISSSRLMLATMASYIQEVFTVTPPPVGLPVIKSIQQERLLEREDMLLRSTTPPQGERSALRDWDPLDKVNGRKSTSQNSISSKEADGVFHPHHHHQDESISSIRMHSPSPDNFSAQVKYKIYYPHANKIDNHPQQASSLNTTLLDARILFAFLDKKVLIGSYDRINAFRVLEKLYLQLFIEPVVKPASDTPVITRGGSPVNGSPPGSRGGGGGAKLRKGHATPPRTPNSPVFSPTMMIDGLPAKILLAEPHLEYYINELRLDDVRGIPEDGPIVKTKGGLRDSMEAMYVGEKWRCARLFLEGYLHTVGRWEQFKAMGHPLVEYLSPMTLSKLDRAVLDLDTRLQQISERFTGPAGDLAYPAMFTGVGKYAQYRLWRAGFADSRKLFLSHLKWVYGSWPPKAGKKGKSGVDGGENGGFNREVLKRVERDMGTVWDLIVDWARPRYPPGGFADDGEDEHRESEEEDRFGRGFVVDDGVDGNDLRSLLEEFDRASPPVQPRPMFDMPRLPILSEDQSSTKSQKKKRSTKLKGDSAIQVLESSWNPLPPPLFPSPIPGDINTASHLIDEFKQMEIAHGKGRRVEDMQEYRKGMWIFVYAVLQSLPLLTVDAPIVRVSEGCEYFLCVGWKNSTLPWEDRDRVSFTPLAGVGSGRGRLFGDAAGMGGGGGGVVNKRASMMWASAPGGSVGHSSPVLMPQLLGAIIPEGLGDDDEVLAAYGRSWCWVRAAGWVMEVEEERAKRREVAFAERGKREWEEEMRRRREEYAGGRAEEGGAEGVPANGSSQGVYPVFGRW